ncbi:MAG: hypothetical protein IJX63_05510 [Lachnospiraceae bacterium]|nr:hypothetical protein [Lachnospiraceae bacterium]
MQKLIGRLLGFAWFVCVFILFQAIKEKRWRKAVICAIMVLVPLVALGLVLVGFAAAGF